ncbi:hypothetical protein FRC08_005811 [Ceratobasidium sp. 394]|nr:hypothetical protein FRC08_005811 [Ceratobasidium sp. 394]KAG9086319.1 hypothetical protein FS749_003725 [Ceratobasidium sp. UAMH 11750]
MATKTLNFYSYALAQDVNLLLVFQPPNSSELYRSIFPAVWKNIKFIGGGHAKVALNYSPRLGFGIGQVQEDDKLVTSSVWTEIKSGQSTKVTGSEDDRRFAPVTPGENVDAGAVCENASHNPINLTLGLIKGDGIDQRFESIFLWKALKPGSTATVEFKPILTAYVVKNYTGGEILLGAVEADPIWTYNLNELDDVTGWNLLQDDATGGFAIERASSP